MLCRRLPADAAKQEQRCEQVSDYALCSVRPWAHLPFLPNLDCISVSSLIPQPGIYVQRNDTLVEGLAEGTDSSP
jgi:hypothetical protein